MESLEGGQGFALVTTQAFKEGPLANVTSFFDVVYTEEDLPNDPRSTSPHMTYVGYRNMLEREAYRGYWEFGRNRNQYSTKKDYTQQVEQPVGHLLLHQVAYHYYQL